MKYATNVPVTIKRNNTISLFDTGATISCMSKACFYKLQPKSKLVQANTYKVNSASRNSLGPTGRTMCTLKFPKKFQHQFMDCKNLLWLVILGLVFSHTYIIGIDWFSSNQLHLHQGPKSIVTLDPAPFPLHVNQNFTLLPPHILIKTVLQVTIPLKTIAIVPTTFNGMPKPDYHYSFMESLIPYKSQQHLFVFVVPVLKYFGKKLPVHLLCTIINTVLMTLSCLKPDTLMRWNCSLALMTPSSH